MKRLLTIGLILLSLSLLAFDVSAQKQVTLERGSSKFLSAGRLTVKFIEVIEDSRCPPDVQCVWAGNAKVKIEIAKGKAAARAFELNSNTDNVSVTYGGYTFTFVDLSREADAGTSNAAAKPKLKIAVAKAK